MAEITWLNYCPPPQDLNQCCMIGTLKSPLKSKGGKIKSYFMLRGLPSNMEMLCRYIPQLQGGGFTVFYFWTEKQDQKDSAAAQTEHIRNTCLIMPHASTQNRNYNKHSEPKLNIQKVIRHSDKPVKWDHTESAPLSWIESGRRYRRWWAAWSWPTGLRRCGWSLPSEQDPSRINRGKEKVWESGGQEKRKQWNWTLVYRSSFHEPDKAINHVDGVI